MDSVDLLEVNGRDMLYEGRQSVHAAQNGIAIAAALSPEPGKWC